MGQIQIYAPEITYSLTDDGDFICTHESYEVTPPCCTIGRDCACQGQYSIDCCNPECTGITDREMELILERYLDGNQ